MTVTSFMLVFFFLLILTVTAADVLSAETPTERLRAKIQRRLGVQPDPAAAKLVSTVAELLDRYGDAYFDEGMDR